MDESTKLILKSMQGLELRSGAEPVSYDVQSLLEESRNRVYTEEGKRLVEAAKGDSKQITKQGS